MLLVMTRRMGASSVEGEKCEYWGSSTAPAGPAPTHWQHNSYKSLRLQQSGDMDTSSIAPCTSDQTELYDTVLIRTSFTIWH